MVFYYGQSASPSLRSDEGLTGDNVSEISKSVLSVTASTVSSIKLQSLKPSSKSTSSPISSQTLSKATDNVIPKSSTYKTGNVVSYSQTAGYATNNLAIPNLSLDQCTAQCTGN